MASVTQPDKRPRTGEPPALTSVASTPLQGSSGPLSKLANDVLGYAFVFADQWNASRVCKKWRQAMNSNLHYSSLLNAYRKNKLVQRFLPNPDLRLSHRDSIVHLYRGVQEKEQKFSIKKPDPRELDEEKESASSLLDRIQALPAKEMVFKMNQISNSF
jgi:hypothetical protein